MPVDVAEMKRKQLLRRWATLEHELALAESQLEASNNAVERSRLKSQIEGIYEELEQVQSQLDSLQADNTPQRRYRGFKENLPKINFREAKRTIEHIIEELEGCATLLLLQNSLPMGGEWCLEVIRRVLDDATDDFKRYPIVFSDGGGLDAPSVLHRIGAHLGLHVNSSVEDYAREIIQTLCGSVQSGSIVYIELKQCDYLTEPVFTWLLDHFWQPLAAQVPMIVQTHRRVKFIVVFVADATLPLDCFNEALCCSLDRFESGQALEVPLRPWTYKEIQVWLEQFSGRTGREVDKLATHIYKVSRAGEPHLVSILLEQSLSH